jgi:putative Holliday junction resolvase
MARILAIDYGAKRSGLAVTDPEQIIASPLGHVTSSALMAYLEDYFRQEDVESVVVGIPLRPDGEDTHATPLIKAFVSRLKKHYPDKNVILHDESDTSRLARASMVAAGTRKKQREKKGNTDAVAATLILQSYLETL